jgi:hypothetical protein
VITEKKYLRYKSQIHIPLKAETSDKFMGEIEEVRQQIILADEDFGKRGLAYFDSLALDRVHLVNPHFGSPFPGIRGSRSLDAALRTGGFSQVAYEIALVWPGYCARPIFGISIGSENREDCNSMRGYISTGRSFHCPNSRDFRSVMDLKLQHFLLGELISVYNALFNGDKK